jgi:formamidopyrimidine-DNA glycosylase
LFFVDQRSFGTLTFTKDPSKEMNKLGLDIQSLRFSELWSRVQCVKLGSRTIEDVLMNQKLVVSGIGNYLKSEVLFLAKIVPFRKASTLTRGDWYRIFRAIQKKLKNRTMYVYQQKVPWVHTYKFKGRTTWWVPGVQI